MHTKHTLRENVHWIIDLNVHMVTYGRQLVLLSGDDLAILGLDLPGGVSFLGEPAGNENTLAIFLGLIGFFALVLDGDGDFGYAVTWAGKGQ
jgi:hypothetical protein